MNRVFQNRALTGLILDLHTLNVFWSPELAFNSAALRWKRNLKGIRARHPFKVMCESQDRLSESKVRPWVDFLEQLVLSCPDEGMVEPPDLAPFTRLTRLSCWYVPDMKFPETLVGLDLKYEDEHGEGPNLPEEIAFPPGLERLELEAKLLDCLGHEGLPKLETLRVFVINPWVFPRVYRTKKSWPPSLNSLGWMGAINAEALVIVCSRSWLEGLPNLTFLSDIHFRIDNSLVLPETLQEYQLSDCNLSPSSFSGLSRLTNLSFRWVDMTPDYCYEVLEQVQKTLGVLNILSFALENLPVLPQLYLLDCLMEPEALPLLNQRIPGVQFLDLLLLIKEDLDLDCSLFPRSCKALILSFSSDDNSCKIRIHGPLPESLEFLSLKGTSMVLESPLPQSIQRLDIPDYLIETQLVPEWVLIS